MWRCKLITLLWWNGTTVSILITVCALYPTIQYESKEVENRSVLFHTGSPLYWPLWVLLSSNRDHVFAHWYLHRLAQSSTPTVLSASAVIMQKMAFGSCHPVLSVQRFSWWDGSNDGIIFAASTIKGALIRIFGADHRSLEAVSADTDHWVYLKPSIYYVALFIYLIILNNIVY